MGAQNSLWQRWRQTRWWVRWLTYVLTVVVGFYVVEDVRGYLALRQAKADYLAAGYRLDPDLIFGESIPDDENFAASELIQNAFNHTGIEAQLPDLGLPNQHRHRNGNPDFHGYHGSYLYPWGNFDFDSEEARKELAEQLEKLAPFREPFKKAALRRKCDWRVVLDPLDPTDLENNVRILNLMPRALWAEARMVYRDDPAIAAENIEVMLSLAQHLSKPSPILLLGAADPIADSTTEIVAMGLYEQVWDRQQLDGISMYAEAYQQLHWKASVEPLLAAVMSERFQKEIGFREVINDVIEYEDAFIKLPREIFGFSLRNIEENLNFLILKLAPRGWIWQNEANVLRWVPEGGVTGRSGPYRLFMSIFERDLQEIRNEMEERPVLGQLIIYAIELEKLYLEKGAYPARGTLAWEEGFGFQIDGTGRPVIWYSPEGKEGELSEGELKNLPHNHLWRYPLDSN